MCAVVPEPPAGALVIGRLDVIGVLVSGEGTNLQALIDAGLPIVAVASNTAGVRALDRAAAAGDRDRASFELADYADPRGARRSDGRLARRAQASTSSSAPATCTS